MRCWHLWLGGLLLLVYIATLSAINVYCLSSGFEDDLERTAEAILAVTDLSEVSAQRVAQLQSAHEVAELFRALSTHHLSVEPRGSFAGASVPVGVTSLAGASLITKYGMGFGGYGGWAGKWFDESNATAGSNMFGKMYTRARPFRVERRHVSAFDGLPATQLNYEITDLAPLRMMRDEVRCFRGLGGMSICLGFGGLTLTGGVINGSPFVLSRLSEHAQTLPQSPGSAGASASDADEL